MDTGDVAKLCSTSASELAFCLDLSLSCFSGMMSSSYYLQSAKMIGRSRLAVLVVPLGRDKDSNMVKNEAVACS